jgi:hypothetical protein
VDVGSPVHGGHSRGFFAGADDGGAQRGGDLAAVYFGDPVVCGDYLVIEAFGDLRGREADILP